MATNVQSTEGSRAAAVQRRGDEHFFLVGAVLMALVLFAGFTLQFAAGRSTFASPAIVHVHAFLFFAWVALYLVQNSLVAAGEVAIHRRLGWLALGLVPAMVVVGTWLTVRMVRDARAPFFFEPGWFLVMNPLSVLTFAGLVGAAIRLRRRTAWHRRLMFCGMAMLLGPGFGRLLPGPLMIPWAGWAIFAAGLLFPIAGAIADLRRSGRIHPAWLWGMGAMLLCEALITPIAHSGAGRAFYVAVTAGHPGSALAPDAFPPPPHA